MNFPKALECFEIRLELETSSIVLFSLSFVEEVSRAVSNFVDFLAWDSDRLSAENASALGKGRILTSEPSVGGEYSFDATGGSSTMEAGRKGSFTATAKSTPSSERSVH
jgi:hypothetical protein